MSYSGWSCTFLCLCLLVCKCVVVFSIVFGSWIYTLSFKSYNLYSSQDSWLRACVIRICHNANHTWNYEQLHNFPFIYLKYQWLCQFKQIFRFNYKPGLFSYIAWLTSIGLSNLGQSRHLSNMGDLHLHFGFCCAKQNKFLISTNHFLSVNLICILKKRLPRRNICILTGTLPSSLTSSRILI